MVRGREESGDGRGDERSMQERLQGVGPRGIRLVEAVHGLVQADAQFDLPAHAVEVSDLPGAGAGQQIRQEKTGPLGGVAPDETKG
jgi:hypothetical protein